MHNWVSSYLNFSIIHRNLNSIGFWRSIYRKFWTKWIRFCRFVWSTVSFSFSKFIKFMISRFLSFLAGVSQVASAIEFIKQTRRYFLEETVWLPIKGTPELVYKISWSVGIYYCLRIYSHLCFNVRFLSYSSSNKWYFLLKGDTPKPQDYFMLSTPRYGHWCP